jgi:hypothetical protein
MKHAGPGALDQLEPLLAKVRAFAGPKERVRGVFYLKSRAFLHFHEDPAGLFADIRAPDAADFDRLKVDDDDGAKALLARLSNWLGAD